MKYKKLWLAHLMSYSERNIKLTLNDGEVVIGKTMFVDDPIGDEKMYFLHFVTDIGVITLKESEIKDIDPDGWDLEEVFG